MKDVEVTKAFVVMLLVFHDSIKSSTHFDRFVLLLVVKLGVQGF